MSDQENVQRPQVIKDLIDRARQDHPDWTPEKAARSVIQIYNLFIQLQTDQITLTNGKDHPKRS